ncbi:hypothetical protein FE257_011042 [Aspergillus nanangensis]|uniref:Uncharacterized protein n=1 Tax=Aspergillus nanangensis TaxID=2582783 RepID=A0AAD4GRQ5_ASPNN|nr:hypothetical protein FE257_011042 [Aspergillus nanangensis]
MLTNWNTITRAAHRDRQVCSCRSKAHFRSNAILRAFCFAVGHEGKTGPLDSGFILCWFAEKATDAGLVLYLPSNISAGCMKGGHCFRDYSLAPPKQTKMTFQAFTERCPVRRALVRVYSFYGEALREIVGGSPEFKKYLNIFGNRFNMDGVTGHHKDWAGIWMLVARYQDYCADPDRPIDPNAIQRTRRREWPSNRNLGLAVPFIPNQPHEENPLAGFSIVSFGIAIPSKSRFCTLQFYDDATGPALHDLDFVGNLQPWTDFERDIIDQYQTHDFRQRQLSTTLRSQVDLPLLDPHAENIRDWGPGPL